MCICASPNSYLCEGVRSPGTGVTDNCELPCGYWELNPGPLEEQAVLLTAEPSLQILLLIFCFVFRGRISLCSSGYPRTHYVVSGWLRTQRSACLCFPSAETKGVCHHCLVFFLSIFKSHFFFSFETGSSYVALTVLKLPM